MREPDLVTAWRAEGELLAVDGHELFVAEKGSRDDPTVVLLHGSVGPPAGPTTDRGLRTEWLGCVLTNGSIFVDMAQLTSGQQMLLSLPDERLAEGLGEESLANGLRQSFPPDRPDPAELEAMVALVHRGDGDRLMPRLIRYIEERRAHQPRFTAGLVDYAGPMIVAWGDLDPIAVPAMADRLAALRTEAGHDVQLVHWPHVGHWPAVEAPTLVAGLLAELQR